MVVTINRYNIEFWEDRGQCSIIDRKKPYNRAIIQFDTGHEKINKQLAELCLKELNTGKYEYYQRK